MVDIALSEAKRFWPGGELFVRGLIMHHKLSP